MFRCRIYVFMVMLLIGAAAFADEGQAPKDRVLEPASIATLALKNLVSRSQKVTVEKLGEIEYTAPGALYPYAWGWDAAVHAAGYAYFDVDRAIAELSASVGGQAPNGMVPHITFYNHTPDKRYYPGPSVWQNRSKYNVPISGISQPPLMAVALEVIVKRAELSGGISTSQTNRLKKLFRAAFEYQNWWYRERDLYDTGVVVSTHPWETGMDNSGAWIEALEAVPIDKVPDYQRVDIKPDGSNRAERPTNKFYDQATVLLSYQRDNGQYSFLQNGKRVESRIQNQSWQMGDVGINGILQRANHALAALASRYGNENDRRAIERWIDKTRKGMQTLLWNEDLSVFVSYDFRTKKQVPVITSGSFLSAFGRVATKAQAKKMAALLLSWRKSDVQYLVPSTAPSDPLFNPIKYWLGPVWPHVNLMIAEGLKDSGELVAAKAVVEDSLALIETYGLKEYYHPLSETGHEPRGLGAGDFGFTSAVYPRFLTLAVELGVRHAQPDPSTYRSIYRYVQQSL